MEDPGIKLFGKKIVLPEISNTIFHAVISREVAEKVIQQIKINTHTPHHMYLFAFTNFLKFKSNSFSLMIIELPG